MSWEKSKRQIVPLFGGLEDATQPSLIRVFGLVQKIKIKMKVKFSTAN